MMEFTLWDILRNLLLAARWTVVLSLAGFVCGGLAGGLLLAARLARAPALRIMAKLYIELFQGTPLLIAEAVACRLVDHRQREAEHRVPRRVDRLRAVLSSGQLLAAHHPEVGHLLGAEPHVRLRQRARPVAHRAVPDAHAGHTALNSRAGSDRAPNSKGRHDNDPAGERQQRAGRATRRDEPRPRDAGRP